MIAIASNTQQLSALLDSHTLVLTPNHRTSVQLYELHGRQQSRSVNYSANIQPVDLWIRELWDLLHYLSPGTLTPRTILEAGQELYLWKHIVRHSESGEALLALDGTAAQVMSAHRILQQWQIPLPAIERFIAGLANSGSPLEDSAAFASWLRSYRQHCATHKLISLSELLQALLHSKAFTQLHKLHALPENIVLFGFDAPPPLYRQLFAELDTLVSLQQHQLPEHTPHLLKEAYPGRHEEIHAALDWAAHLLNSSETVRVAIICPELQQRSADIERQLAYAVNLPSLRVDVQKFHHHPFIASALMCLQFNNKKLPVLTACQFLRSAFIIGGEIGSEEDARAALEYKLRRAAESHTTVARFRTLLAEEEQAWHCPGLAAALAEYGKLRPVSKDRQGFSDWADLFEQQFACLLAPQAESELLLLNELMLDFRKLDALGISLTLEQALASLQQLATNKLLPQSSNERLQILTPTEAAGLEFSHTWIMGLSETEWPPATSSNPFIPYRIQQEHQVPGSSIALCHEEAMKTLTGICRHTSTEVVFSYARYHEEQEHKASQLLTHFPGTFNEHETRLTVVGLQPAAWQLFEQQSSALTWKEEALRIPLADAQMIRGGTSLIADQAACPFRSFAKHRLQARELPALSYGLTPAALGNILHQALESLWYQLGSSEKLQAASPDELDSFIDHSVQQAMQRARQQYPHTMQPRFTEIESRRLTRLLHQWLEQERQRSPFKVLGQEVNVTWHYSELQLNFRIDRIDELADGSQAVIDYKSGQSNSMKWLDERQDKPQLLLYADALYQLDAETRVSALLYAQINIEKIAYLGITEHDTIYPGLALDKQKDIEPGMDWQSLTHYWQRALQQTAQLFLDGYLAVEPKNASTCQYCHLGSLCRIAEQDALLP